MYEYYFNGEKVTEGEYFILTVSTNSYGYFSTKAKRCSTLGFGFYQIKGGEIEGEFIDYRNHYNFAEIA